MKRFVKLDTYCNIFNWLVKHTSSSVSKSRGMIFRGGPFYVSLLLRKEQDDVGLPFYLLLLQTPSCYAMIIQEHHLRISKGVDGRMVDVNLRLTPL